MALTATGIVVERLSKSFRGARAVDTVSFTAAPGAVTGLLGPNGSGKTTVLRLMTGLVRGTGVARFNGVRFAEYPYPRDHIGVSIGAAPFNAARTGIGHLEVIAAGARLDPSRARSVLAMVGLEEAADQRIKSYSLGMRQRLALATAMLGDPEFVVLDEPTNGLDPAAVLWFAGWVRKLADEGRCVLLSTHQLHEAERFLDHAVVLVDGQVRAQGSISELHAKAGLPPRILAHTSPAAAADQLALELTDKHINATRVGPDGVVVPSADPDLVAKVARDAGIGLRQLVREEPSLDVVFAHLCAGSQAIGPHGAATVKQPAAPARREVAAGSAPRPRSTLSLARYEWTRWRSLRATWWTAASVFALTAVVSGLLAYAAVHGTAHTGVFTRRDAWPVIVSQGAALGAPYATGFVGALLGVHAWTEDVSGGMAASTLTTFRRRLPVALARFAAIGITAGTLAVAACLLAVLVGSGFLGAHSSASHLSEIAVKSLRVIAYAIALALIAGALSVLLRSGMLAAFTLLLLPWLIEPLVGQLFLVVPFLEPHLDWLRFLPFRAMGDMAADFTFDGGFSIGPPHLGLWHATWESLALTSLLTLCAVGSFCLRDPVDK